MRTFKFETQVSNKITIDKKELSDWNHALDFARDILNNDLKLFEVIVTNGCKNNKFRVKINR